MSDDVGAGGASAATTSDTTTPPVSAEEELSRRLAANFTDDKMRELAAQQAGEAAKYGLRPIASFGVGPRVASKAECDACGAPGAVLRCSRCNSACVFR